MPTKKTAKTLKADPKARERAERALANVEPVPEHKPNPVRYAQLVAKGWPKRQAATAAGYSKNSNTAAIDKLISVRRALGTIEKQRQDLAVTMGVTHTDCVMTAAAIMGDEEAQDRDRLEAVKVVSGLQGYNAPTKIQSESRSLIMEFSNLTSSDLQVLLGQITTGGQV